MSLADQEARDRIESDLGTTLVVEAAAGTGKTTALVRRITSLLAAGLASLDRIVALTFTDAAAGELKLRLRSEIERARESPDRSQTERDHLTAALPHLEQARIGTIHSFCADLLRERPVEAGVDPRFDVAADDAAGALFSRAFDRWFEAQLQTPSEGVRRVLRRVPGWGQQGPRDLLRSAARELRERRDFPHPWRRDPFDRKAAIDELLQEVADLGAFAARGNPDDYFTRCLLRLSRFTGEVERRERLRERDYDGLESELRDLSFGREWKWVGFRRSDDPTFPKAELIERRDALKKRLGDFVATAGADLAPLLRDDLWEVVTEYERLKANTGTLDFLDLQLRARDLIRDDEDVRRELARRFSHVFVDEFQDTDPLQMELLLLLASEDPTQSDWHRVTPTPGKLFLVGDPKQSIYRFRRADVALYESVKQRLVDRGAELVHLRVSFRMVPEIQDAVNAAFAARMTGSTPSQAHYVGLEPARPPATHPAVIALPVPAPYGDYGKIVRFRIEDSAPEAVGGMIEWLVRESGWTVTERESGEAVPMAPRHICVLFRRLRSARTDVVRPYVRALEARHIPHLLVGGSSFHLREEIAALRNAMSAVERPQDELMVYATLKGPLFALTDAELLAFREMVGPLHPYRRVDEAAAADASGIIDAMALLRRLHRGRNRRPIADTIALLLEETRAHAGFAIWPTGEQALANIGRLMDMARRAERRGLTSFRSFVQNLHDEADRGEAGEAPLFEEGAEGVRIMTVHKAKGLEFPVVILADPTAGIAPSEPSRWVDTERRLCAQRLAGYAPPELLENAEGERNREREEADRLLYVAATRARDLLVVPTVGDERLEDTWLDALLPAVYPAPGKERTPEERTISSLPEFGEDSIAVRPPRAARGKHTVAPGRHQPEAGDHRVVWWDPAALPLGRSESLGLRQQKLLTADEAGKRSGEGVSAHERWREERRTTRERAARADLRIAIPSDPEAETARSRDAARSIEHIQLDIEPSRPTGTRFGSLVHAILATAGWDDDAAALAAHAELQGRILGAPSTEIEAAATAAGVALAHPLLRNAAAADGRRECLRESPLALTLPDGTLIEGIVDAAYRDPGADPVWTVIDFKTDRDPTARDDAYERQVDLYVRAIQTATGESARGILLRV